MAESNKVRINQTKNKITSWLEDVGVKYEVSKLEEKELSDLLEFIILANIRDRKYSIYTMKKFPDRVIIQGEISLIEEHRKITRDMDNAKYNTFIINLQDKLTSYDVRYEFVTEGKQVNIIKIHQFIHYDVLDKDRFLQTYVRVQEVSNIIINLVSFGLGVATPSPTSTASADTPSFIT